MSTIREKLERHRAALGTYAAHYLGEDPVYEIEEILSVRRVRGGVVKVTARDGESLWYYRGHKIERCDDVTPGFYGRWYSGRRAAGLLADLLRELETE